MAFGHKLDCSVAGWLLCVVFPSFFFYVSCRRKTKTQKENPSSATWPKRVCLILLLFLINEIVYWHFVLLLKEQRTVSTPIRLQQLLSIKVQQIVIGPRAYGNGMVCGVLFIILFLFQINDLTKRRKLCYKPHYLQYSLVWGLSSRWLWRSTNLKPNSIAFRGRTNGLTDILSYGVIFKLVSRWFACSRTNEPFSVYRLVVESV